MSDKRGLRPNGRTDAEIEVMPNLFRRAMAKALLGLNPLFARAGATGPRFWAGHRTNFAECRLCGAGSISRARRCWSACGVGSR
jgi:hypothetical protein